MSQFDPYLTWLGIPAHEQPPNFYRLLGIVLFESNPALIEQAADRQSLTVGTYQGGPQGELCQRLLSEIAMARFNLLDPQQKAGYDSHLQGMLAHRGERSVAAPPPPGFAAPARPQPLVSQPVYSPQAMQPPMTHARPAPWPQGYRGAMPVPAAVPLGAPFPVARAVSSGTVPAAPPAIPPAAPRHPMDELESLAAQSGNRRQLTKKKRRTDYSKEIMFGGITAAAGVVLVIIYIAAQGPNKTGMGAIGDPNNPPNLIAPNPVSEKPKPETEKKDAAVATPKSKVGGSPTPAESSSPPRKTPVASDESDSRNKIPAAHGAPRRPNRKDISPQDLGGPDDPVMGKPDE